MRIVALYFSPAQTTRKIVMTVAAALLHRLSSRFKADFLEIDITSPRERRNILGFSQEDIVIFGSPVYIGRMPNLIAPYYRSIIGGGAFAVPVAVYGNRNYDDALIELRDILTADGFRCIAAAAFIGEHAFSKRLAAGRPDDGDLEKAEDFGREAAERILAAGSGRESFREVRVPGNPYPYGGFYRATDAEGHPIDIRKAKPLTDPERCDRCGICAEICPMEAIDRSDFGSVPGICIKCGACVKRCPKGAKHFEDAAYLSHLHLLEERFGQIRREPEMFF